jgi:imidazolonepropionase
MNTLIANIGQLVTPVSSGSRHGRTMPLDVRENTQLLVSDGRIVAVGTTNRHANLEIDARGGVVLPGLIDPHTHFSPLPRAASAGRSSPTWTTDPPEARRRQLERRLRRALSSGVTTVEVKCRGLDELADLAAVARSDDTDLPGIVATLFAAAVGAGHAERMSGLIADEIPTVRQRRLAQFCDILCGRDAYSLQEARTILRAARAGGLQLKLHVDGEPGGGLADVAVELGVTAIGHVMRIDEDDASKLAKIGVIPVLLPGGGSFGAVSYPDARGMIGSGLSIGLGTDAGSAPIGVGSMWMVIALAVAVLGLSLNEAITATTLHNAHALELGAEIGSLEPGKRADILILEVDDARELLGNLGQDFVRFVIRNGKIVYQR